MISLNGLGNKFPLKQVYQLYCFIRYYPIHKSRKHEVTVGSISFQMNLTPSNGSIDRCLLSNREYEPEITELILENLPNQGTFVDVGANIGYYSLLASQSKPDAKIIALEPAPQVYDLFIQNVTLNSANVDAYNLAAGSDAGVANLTVDLKNIGHNSLIRDKFKSKSLLTQEIKVVKLDQLLQGLDIDLIKIDVEGFELSVIEGSKKILSRCKPILILEWSPMIFGYEQKQSNNLWDILVSMGYSLYDIDHEGKEITHSDYLNSFNQINILAK